MKTPMPNILRCDIFRHGVGVGLMVATLDPTPAGGDTFLVKKKSVRNMPFHPQIWSTAYDKGWKS